MYLHILQSADASHDVCLAITSGSKHIRDDRVSETRHKLAVLISTEYRHNERVDSSELDL